MIGIQNRNNKCFAISSFQLLARAFDKDYLLQFNLQDDTLCSLWKDTVLKLRYDLIRCDENYNLNIGYFIDTIVFNSNHLFTLGKEEDSSEFLLYLIDKLSSNTKNLIQPNLHHHDYLLNLLIINKLDNTSKIGKILWELINSFKHYMKPENNIGWCDKFNWFGCWILINNNGEYSINIEQMTSLILPIYGNNLLDCITNYFKKEIVDCNGEQKIKQLFIWYFPNYLIITLNRFNQNGQKNNNFIDCPTQIDLTHLEFNNVISKYNLVGCICHVGNTNGGHYYSIVFDDNQWWKIDDESVVKLNQFNSNNAYILMYERIFD